MKRIILIFALFVIASASLAIAQNPNPYPVPVDNELFVKDSRCPNGKQNAL
ncbi:MAG: hypothetical protein OEZ04_02990 [Nitrospinota bacterium]|nr:hypothetical protein [Nitrospinota bacterium]